jgi:hypothetical protein
MMPLSATMIPIRIKGFAPTPLAIKSIDRLSPSPRDPVDAWTPSWHADSTDHDSNKKKSEDKSESNANHFNIDLKGRSSSVFSPGNEEDNDHHDDTQPDNDVTNRWARSAGGLGRHDIAKLHLV